MGKTRVNQLARADVLKFEYQLRQINRDVIILNITTKNNNDASMM